MMLEFFKGFLERGSWKGWYRLLLMSKKRGKIAQPFLGVCTSINPLDWNQNSTAIPQTMNFPVDRLF